MNDEQLLRYSRHILLDEIGIEAQQRLIDATALVIGAGGLGSPAALYLASAGIGRILLADGDTVDLTNLQRQVLHTTDRVGMAKVESARVALGALNPEVEVIALPRLVDVDAALRARSYRPGTSIVLEVRDELCPWNAGRYRVGDEAGRTGGTPDLALDVAELASLYLGGHDAHALAHAGLVEERTEGAVEAASLLFRTDLPPYCPEVF